MPALDLRAVLAVVAACAVAACSREERAFEPPARLIAGAAGVRADRPAPAAMPAPGEANPFGENAWAMGQGGLLFDQMNCSGCHFHGGGGMGPALMDGAWIYGEDDASVFTTIIGGRPNGMPSYRGRISDAQAWQLVAYVKSLGGNESSASAAARDDHMSVRPGPARTDPQPITKQEAP